MKFIEISEGVCVRKEDIVSIEKKLTGGSRIATETRIYESDFHYDTILQLLEMEKIEEKVSHVGADTVNLWGSQHWRG